MRLLGAILCVLLLATPAAAYRWNFVEVELSPRPDGKATVVYKAAIDPEGANLHGFYFQGYGARPHFDTAQCYATDSAGRVACIPRGACSRGLRAALRGANALRRSPRACFAAPWAKALCGNN